MTVRASSGGILIPGARGKLLASVYFPEGEGPYPVVVLCHGLPGIERLQDFAIELREAGFAALLFHYSGSWGSDGNFSVAHCLQDVDSVFAYIKKNEKHKFDLSRVYILGHSMGGLIASHALADIELVKAGVIIMPANMANDYRDTIENPRKEQEKLVIYNKGFSPWLRNFSWDVMKKEAEMDLARFDLTTYATAMAQKPVMTIAGTEDVILAKDRNIDILRRSIKGAFNSKANLEEFDVVTDHGMNFNRSEIKKTAIDFLKKIDATIRKGQK